MRLSGFFLSFVTLRDIFSIVGNYCFATRLYIDRNTGGIMIATIASILVAYWIFHASVSAKKNPWVWISICIVAFYACMQIWSSLVLKPFYGRQFYEHTMGTALTIEVTSVIFGLLVISLIRFKLLKKRA